MPVWARKLSLAKPNQKSCPVVHCRSSLLYPFSCLYQKRRKVLKHTHIHLSVDYLKKNKVTQRLPTLLDVFQTNCAIKTKGNQQMRIKADYCSCH